MRILFTGISSFTGCWFARALAAAGHEVVGPLRGSSATYDGAKRARVEQLLSGCRLVPETAFGTDAFKRLLQESGPWDLLCHHAAETGNYRSPDFDVPAAVRTNCLDLRTVLAIFRERGGKAVVLTGSVFENDEGGGAGTRRAFSGYGLAKGLTWQMFRFYCEQAGVRLGKFVIPNPFGPWEEPRFTAYLMRTWKQGQAAAVKTPDYIRDNIHIGLLTEVYVRFAMDIAVPGNSPVRINPSGYVESQGAFAERVAREVRLRAGWTCGLELARQQDFSEPLERFNTDAAQALVPGWNEKAAWDSFVDFYQRVPS
ncbi:MAG TPA: NAD(P)-dependent oxidoreductase [Verrucomicrobiae bacterium]